jgi:ABC-2 type transport system permease protein
MSGSTGSPLLRDRAGDDLRPRPGVILVPRLVWYQLVLLIRSPIGTFISLVIPLMLLVALDLVTPEMTLQSLGGVRMAQFLTPAMASFAVLNVGFVDLVIGVTLARDEGILRRLHSSPLPAWVYFVGRLATAVLVTTIAVAIVCGVGVVFLHVHLAPRALPRLAGTAAAGLAMSFALGLAISTLVPSALGALPIAYALLLPVAFISQVFFPAPTEARWLRDLAGALPVQPFANGMEAAFSASSHPLSVHGLFVMGCWTFGALLVAYLFFSWDPGGKVRRRFLSSRGRRSSH